MRARIAEVFESVQGEGIYTGEKQIFVRFFGCNLSCRYCDTKQYGFMECELEELLEKIKSYKGNYHSVSFTGGEPLLQNDFLKEILKLTHAQGYKNYLETNGTLAFSLKEVIDDVDIVAMDVKLPSSTGMGNLWWMHHKFLEIASSKEVFIKAVICESTTQDDLKEAINLIKKTNPKAILVLQPNSGENSLALRRKTEDFQKLCQTEGVSAAVMPQVHKALGLK
ncbi:MAG: 7-carboxy-7-deazaguanine synthase QueE [Candidatus Omnitrophica bacterium]|nr:7-carboxy-7-deazaguanine synthase QueE [Candidatus Omnitrophota bacterium]MDD5238271.1 7-carboxy-7-deazaguanine synthase QueE [Candidatus Omnitrophota bacterium]